MITEATAQELAASAEKPIAISVGVRDIAALHACHTSPTMYSQLLLAKLRDAGCTAVEGSIKLQLSHGQLFKLKDNPLKPQEEFRYLWLPDAYVTAVAQGVAHA